MHNSCQGHILLRKKKNNDEDRGTLTGKIGSLQLMPISPVTVKHMKWARKIDTDV